MERRITPGIHTFMKCGGVLNFWESLDNLVSSHELVIDRPKGSSHPRFPDFIYPLDYGYLKGTVSGDGAGMDVWLGSIDDMSVQAIICTVDLLKEDLEIKIVVGCTDEEIEMVMNYRETSNLSAILVNRTA